MKPYSFPDMSKDNADIENIEADAGNLFTRIFVNGKEACSENYTSVKEVTENKDKDLKDSEELGYIKGFEKGEKEGLKSAESRIEALLKSLKEVLSGIDKAQKELMKNIEREAVELSLSIARKIVCQEIATDRSVVLNVVKEALTKVANHKKIKIRLNPIDLEYINEFKTQIPGLTEDFEKVQFEGDGSIKNGGCIIDTRYGDIDARIEKQLQAVEDAFKAEIAKLSIGS